MFFISAHHHAPLQHLKPAERADMHCMPLAVERPHRVKSGKARYEQMLSAYPPIATAKRTSRHVRYVPQADIAANQNFRVVRVV
jgi:hypothetical protein